MSEFKYVGSELELFAKVHNWKSYWSSQLRPYVIGEVVEVGAGIGANTAYLGSGNHGRWICLEPDGQLASQLAQGAKNAGMKWEVVCGTLKDLAGSQFDSILYIDVLEHIEDDQEELRTAAGLLREHGRLIVLAPAHESLFTEFDAAVGHFRRYDRATLASVAPRELRAERIWYLDSVGLLLSAANRLLLRQSMPTQAQLMVWDQYVVPASRVIDKWTRGRVGKSVVGIWRKQV